MPDDEVANQRQHPPTSGRIEPDGRFIEKQQLRIVDDCDGELEPCSDVVISPPPEGEGYFFTLDERAEIDAELEVLLDELSRERLR